MRLDLPTAFRRTASPSTMPPTPPESLPARLPATLAVVWVAAASLLAPHAASAEFEPRFHPTLQVSRANGEILIDGELDDAGWREAALADNFAEVDPGDQVEPPVQSLAMVTYDDENLYVALIAKDDPANIRVSINDRDNIFRDDYFGVMIDTYGELAWGYEFFVNAYGIQGDLRVLSSGDEEMSFDVVWESEGRITDDGYQVEIAIPFASLRFPERPTQTWRVNFWRDHQREVRRRYAWAAQDRDDPCWMCQWGYLTGIENIRPGSNLEFIGSLVGNQAGERTDFGDPTSRFDNDKLDGAAALNVRYGISSNALAELAFNPDFSQVESDAGQIDVNSPFALFFPERRPFFQEGSDQFNTWINAIYTRSINDPIAAGKFSAQFGKTSLSYTVAADENTPLLLPFKEFSEFVGLDRSVSNVLRVRQAIKEDTYIGGLVTDRRVEGGGAGTVVSVDGLARVFKNYQLEVQGAFSRTEEPDLGLPEDDDFLGGIEFGDGHTGSLDGETYWGHAVYASLERGGRIWNADFDYWGYSPEFRTDNGFTTNNDYKQTSLWTGLFFRPNTKVLTNWEPSIGVGRIWDYDDHFEDEWIRPALYFSLVGQTNLFLQQMWSSERFGRDGEVIDGIRISFVELGSRFSEVASASGSVRWGQGIRRNPSDPELGDQLDVSADMTIKPTSQMVIQPEYAYSRMRSRRSDVELAELGRGRTLYNGYILRTRLTYNFTREWFMRLVLQYNDFSTRFDVEPLLTYRVNPFTVFYIGATSRMNYYERDDRNDPPAYDEQWELTSRQFFAKVQYLFRI